MRPWALSVCVAALAAASCGGSNPSESPGEGTLVGTERLGWDQPAADADEVSTFRFIVYVDNVRQVLTGVTCGQAPALAGFPCTSALPIMSPGTHVLEIASYRVENPTLESPRSLPLTVTLSGGITTPGGLPTDDAAQPVADAIPDTQTVRTRAGVTLRADVVSRAVEGVTALAFDPDGVLFVSDRFGRVQRLEPGGRLSEALVVPDAITTATGGGVLGLALDPQYSRTRFVYIVDAVSGRAQPEFRVSRYREAGGLLGERAVLLGGVAASAEPSAAIAVAGDGRLLVAFDDGEGAGGYSGALLRLNPDGTTPAEQRAASPVIAAGLGSPRSMAWDAEAAAWWLADPLRRRLEQFRINRRTGVTRTTVTVSGLDAPTAVAVVAPGPGRRLDRTVALIASAGETPLVLVQPGGGRSALDSEPLILDGVARVTAIVDGPDGAAYLAAGRTLVRLGLQ